MNDDIFKSLLKSSNIFKNKEVLRPSYVPDILPHREKNIDELASVLVPALKGETPSNVFIYGKTGTGKTAVTRYVGKRLSIKGSELNRVTHFVYINCEIVDTQYRVLQNIANHFMEDWSERIPFTGWPTDEVYSKLVKRIDNSESVVIIVLDEVDKLKGDEVLYNLSRMNSCLQKAKTSLIGISNDLKFTEFLDPRVKSSLGEENMIFPPYAANQLENILGERAKIAFKENVLDESVIPLCSALAAQEHGDARRALDLLRVSAEIADRSGENKILEEHVRLAVNKIEIDRVKEVVSTLPAQSKMVLMAAVIGDQIFDVPPNTGDIYNVYKQLCMKAGMDILTQRRIADLISELDMLGIITARVISKGRYGRTKEIQVSTPIRKIEKILSKDDIIPDLPDLKSLKLKIQSRLL
ncbi:MAG: ORC1-type DNA replication protein [Candidatus Thermoplasmatota archaeon]|nr:ORC1-type DNA replication protein [Candidatus Thermoplasmatota archaeon]